MGVRVEERERENTLFKDTSSKTCTPLTRTAMRMRSQHNQVVLQLIQRQSVGQFTHYLFVGTQGLYLGTFGEEAFCHAHVRVLQVERHYSVHTSDFQHLGHV